ncbi:MAG: D-alanyl-D-alanine carboxypeptidase/D-alanyl-D-alanine-endopeptidase [Prevotella sp.]|nr:D-alanyl-D-alanine carboxypeptidase/D-alanyl-D-alanine-endopeptidase [Prevotella sp.]MBQ8487969.1 D-alanyl-D-alanine carboxypeptidase/D-alanyl-D-alanine-endopeptidase [Prevotella sp.]
MKKNLLTILTFCLCLPLLAQTDTLVVDSLPWPQRLQAKIDSILATPLLQTTQLGLMVYDLTADSTLYTYGHRQRLRPASTMKLLTAITALDQLGGDYQLKTSLYYTGTVSGGTLRGNLHCVGGMDPMFDRTDMLSFVNKVRHLGIDTICGSIVVDLSFKDDDRLGEGWCWDDDNAVLTPLLYDGKDCFVEQFARELRRDGVVMVDTTVHVPMSSRRHVTSRSHGVDEVLVRMMKESDNLYAESLFYQLSGAGSTKSATGKLSAGQVRRMIQKLGLQPGDYRVADGSGLSLYNYVSAELEVQMLRYAYQHSNIYRQLFPALPVAGVDGTLKSRMRKTPAEGNVHAKTGSVSGISSLAGYCLAANGHRLCFAIINQGVSRMSDGRNMQDELCTAFCE